MPNSVIDQLARDSALRAIAMIEAHERICAERQGNLIVRLSIIERMLNRGTVITIGAMGSVIVTLIGMLVKGASIH